MNFKNNFMAVAALFSILFFSTSAGAQTATDNNLKDISTPLSNSLSYITQLEPVSFQYDKAEAQRLNLSPGVNYGFDAEQLQQVVPGVVKTRNKMVPAGKNSFKTVSMKSVDLESLVPLLVGSIKEQQVEIEQLKAAIEDLKRQIKK